MVLFSQCYRKEEDGARETNRHTNAMMKKCYSFLQQDQFCDITVKIGGHSFHAHKMILAAASNYFEAMFTGGFVESTKSEVEIDKQEGEVFKTLLDYAYTGKLEVTADTVVKVLSLACYLQFDGAVSGCCQELNKDYISDRKLSLKDGFTLETLARIHGGPLESLAGHGVSLMAVEFPDFVKMDTFMEEMCAELFEEILMEPELACYTAEVEVRDFCLPIVSSTSINLARFTFFGPC